MLVDGEGGEGEGFDPVSGTYRYKDRGWKRYWRGYMKRPWFNTWNVVYFLGSLATTALGMYSSIDALMLAFSSHGDGGVATSFGCASPVG